MVGTSGHHVEYAFREISKALRMQTDLQNCEDLDDKIREVAINQVALGQRAFLGGLWNRTWIRIQVSHAIRNKHRSIEATPWMKKVIGKYQDLVRSMLFERNEQLHRKETSEENIRGNNKVNAQIDEIYRTLSRVARN